MLILKKFLESGLKHAQSITNALYKGSVEALGELSSKDIKEIFAGSTYCELLPELGLNVLQLAMKVKCFPTESKYIPNCINYILYWPI